MFACLYIYSIFGMAVNRKAVTISAITAVVIAFSVATISMKSRHVKEEVPTEIPFELHLVNSV